MELKVKHKFTCTYGHDSAFPRTKFFTIPIGQYNTVTESGLQFECGGLVIQGNYTKELSFYVDQMFPAVAVPSPANNDDENDDREQSAESDRIFSCQWSLKARAVMRRNEAVIFESKGENEGVITEVWGPTQTQTRRNIHTIVLGRDCGDIYDFVRHSEPEKTLTVEAEVEVMAKVHHHHDNGPRPQPVKEMMLNSQPMGLDLLELLRKDAFDVTIKCDLVDIKAHKVVLKSYSPVFARMLDSPMDESATSVIHVRDFEPETIQDMITFMYAGTLNTCSNKDSLVALLDCAEKYDIAELKVAVIKKMLANITPENAGEFAAALTTFRADDGSKQAIFDYVRANLSQLTTNSLFRQFFKENVQFLL